MSSKPRSLKEFEEAHCETKIKDLQKQLNIERAKVAALTDSKGRAIVEDSKSNTLLFGLTGDYHFGSLYHHGSALAAFYAHCKKRGVKLILNCGDVLAGHKVYKGQEFELRDLGLDAQIARIAKDAPRNIKTKFITGNHDSSFKNQAGVCVGKAIEQAVPSFEFIGEDQAKVEFKTPNGPYSVSLLHPGGGSAYSLSYKSQKIVDSLEGGTKPNLLGIGHYHKAELMPTYRNVTVVQSGTFEKQTPFMARGGLAAHVGGWIIEVTVGKTHNSIRSEFVAFYD